MKKNHLLIDEPPLQVLPSLAVAIGLNEAIVVQQLHYWLSNQKTDGFVDETGEKWIYNTYSEWKENFPFWSESTIQRIFSSLEKSGIIVSEQKDKSKYDRKKYYRLAYDMIDDSNLGGIERVKLGGIEDVKLTRSLNDSETTPETTTDTGSVQDALEKANRKVDMMLKLSGEGKLSYPGRERFPEPIRDLLDVFVEVTGIKPIRNQQNDWFATGSDWVELGATKQDIRDAYKRTQPDWQGKGGFPVVRPGSLTATLQAVVGDRRKSGKSQGSGLLGVLDSVKG